VGAVIGTPNSLRGSSNTKVRDTSTCRIVAYTGGSDPPRIAAKVWSDQWMLRFSVRSLRRLAIRALVLLDSLLRGAPSGVGAGGRAAVVAIQGWTNVRLPPLLPGEKEATRHE